MNTLSPIRPNSLGDVRAEVDAEMLRNAFLETPDYRTLIETSDRSVVVGRRGTGKSALALQLAKFFAREQQASVVEIAPSEDQTIGMRPRIAKFGDSFSTVRAGARLVWRYALMMEAANALSPIYTFKENTAYPGLRNRVQDWMASGTNVFARYLATLKRVTTEAMDPEERIGELSAVLELSKVEEAVLSGTERVNHTVVLLIDRLDEGYTPDVYGAALVDGLVQASIDVKTRLSCVRPIVFLRDNMLRAVQQLDPDYSRNIEASVLRLHWDVGSLFTFAAKRLQLAFELPHEANRKIWDGCVSTDLAGQAGFKRCLQHTLYRPRDVLALLNKALFEAGKRGSSGIRVVRHDIEAAARQISHIRFEDLRKEYDAILPGLASYIGAFDGGSAELTFDETMELLGGLLERGSDIPIVQQEFDILDNPLDLLSGLYSIGFLGIREGSEGAFVFCHDGRAADREFVAPDRVLVHPCYWMALNIGGHELEAFEAEEIYDEYDIETSSQTPQIRSSRIEARLGELEEISVGAGGSAAFERWCEGAIRICFAKGLRNVELKPNRSARLRRDVVGTNLADDGAWKRVREDYGTRQVVFEIKNLETLESADYQQMVSYLTGDYGRLGFFVTRSRTTDLHKNRDVEWVREMYAQHNVLMIKLTAEFFCKQLRKLQQPQKHDAVDNSIHSLLDTYSRLYVAGETKPDRAVTKSRRKRQRREKRRRGVHEAR